MPSNLPPQVLTEDETALDVFNVGAPSDGAKSTREVEHILRNVYDETQQAIRFVEVT